MTDSEVEQEGVTDAYGDLVRTKVELGKAYGTVIGDGTPSVSLCTSADPSICVDTALTFFITAVRRPQAHERR